MIRFVWKPIRISSRFLLDRILIPIYKTIAKIFASFERNLDRVFRFIFDPIRSIGSFSIRKMKIILDFLYENSKKIGNFSYEKISVLFGKIGKIIRFFYGHWKKIVIFIHDKTSNLVSFLAGKIGKIGRYFYGYFMKISTFVYNKSYDSISFLFGKIGKISRFFYGYFKKISTFICNKLYDSISFLVGKTGKILRFFYEHSKKILNSIYNKLFDSLSSLVQKIGRIVRYFYGYFKKISTFTYNKSYDCISFSVKKMIRILEILEKMVSFTGKKIKTVFDFFYRNLKKMSNFVYRKISDFGAFSIGKFTRISNYGYKKLSSFGKNIIDPTIRRISNGIYDFFSFSSKYLRKFLEFSFDYGVKKPVNKVYTAILNPIWNMINRFGTKGLISIKNGLISMEKFTNESVKKIYTPIFNLTKGGYNLSFDYLIKPSFDLIHNLGIWTVRKLSKGIDFLIVSPVNRMMQPAFKSFRWLIGIIVEYFFWGRGLSYRGYYLEIVSGKILMMGKKSFTVCLKDGSTYSIIVESPVNSKCIIRIDGVEIGRFWNTSQVPFLIERPVHLNKKFTFVLDKEEEGKENDFEDAKSTVSVTFIPQQIHAPSINRLNPMGPKKGFMLFESKNEMEDDQVNQESNDIEQKYAKGKTEYKEDSNQNFGQVNDNMLCDESAAVTLTARLVGF